MNFDIPQISDREFEEIKEIMYKKTGVFLKFSKKVLVISRLRSRFKELGINDFESYLDRLRDENSGELEIFINAITTNETYFFRYLKQFEILKNEILPEIICRKKLNGDNRIQIWSAACSNGPEPYSIAIILNEMKKELQNFKVNIYATDINSSVLEEAKKGLYSKRDLRETPLEYQQKYFTVVPKENSSLEFYQLDEDIMDKVIFMHHNLRHEFKYRNIDIIYLRNVMIYFSRDVKIEILNSLEKVSADNSYLFISLSESLLDLDTKYERMGHGIYKKVETV